MKKIIIWIIIIVAIGGAFRYLMSYDKDNPENSDYIDSTKDFVEDGLKTIDEGIDKGSEIINEYKKSKTDSSESLENSTNI